MMPLLAVTLLLAAAADLGRAAAPKASQVSVLPGGALQIDTPADVNTEVTSGSGSGGSFVLRSAYSFPGPHAYFFAAETNATHWQVTVDRSRAAAGVWSIVGVGKALSVHRTVWLNNNRISFNDSITVSTDHPSQQKLPASAEKLLGLQTQHILQFPAGTNATNAIVAGTQFLDATGRCNNANNVDEFGVHRGCVRACVREQALQGSLLVCLFAVATRFALDVAWHHCSKAAFFFYSCAS